MKNGGEMAVEDINAAGGVLGKKLDLPIGDDACDPKQAVAVANQMTGAGVKLVAGHYCSGSSIPASKVYAESDMVQISPASTNPTFTDDRAGPNIYRVCGRDDQQGSVAGKYLASHFADKNIAFVHDKTAYGKGLADETKKAMTAAGKKEVDVRSHHRRREGLFRARLQAQAGQYRCRLFRRLSHRGRADHPPDARSGHEHHPDGRRRADHPGVLVDHRRRPAKAR